LKYLKLCLKWGAVILLVFGAFFLVFAIHLEGQQEVFGKTIMFREHIKLMKYLAIGYLAAGGLIVIGFLAYRIYKSRR
jgi:hypothetical protein